MEAKVLFSLWLCINGAFGIFMGIQYLLVKKPKDKINTSVFLVCIASGIWSLGFGFMFPQATENAAYICRSIGIFGTFLYMMSAMTIISIVSGIKEKIQFLFNGFSYLGAFLYIATIQPGQTSYKLTKYGMTYEFTPGIICTLYNIYFVVVSLNILIVTFYMIRKGANQRTKVFGKRILFVSAFVIGGTIFDMVFPAIGYPALPGSNITQFYGLLVLWCAVRAINKNEITLGNMSEYIYYSVDFPVIVFDTKKIIRILNSSASEYLRVEDFQLDRKDFKVSDFFESGNEIFDFEDKSSIIETNCIVNGISSQLKISKINDQFNDVIGYIVMINDMTERNRAFRKLENARKVSDAANVSKSLFLANMSHEIRTPMNSILGFIELALREDDIQGTAREYFQDIKGEAEGLFSILNDVLNISRIEAGKTEIVNAPYHPAQIFAEMETIFAVKAEENKLDFEMNIEDEFPEELEGDRDKIREVLKNLLTNAIRFTESGRVGLHASAVIKGEEAEIKLSVTDTGKGIKDEEKEKVFENYEANIGKGESVDNASLSLAITKGLVEKMGGELTFESVYGLGTSFTITLKQKVIDGSPIKREQPKFNSEEVKHSSIKKPLHFKDIDVLSVDDNAINLKVVSKTMDKYDINHENVDSGQKAIDRCKNNNYDVVLMDQMMPEMDGVEAMEHIREIGGSYAKGGSSKIVAITANAVDGIEQELLDKGFDGFIGKPINFSVFEDTICRMVPEDKYYFGDKEKQQAATEEIKEQQSEEATAQEVEEHVLEEQAAKEKPAEKAQETKAVETQAAEEPAEEKSPREINYAKGLENFGDDEESYKEILSFVVETEDSDLEELLGLYNDKNYEEFTIKVHGMKSQCYYVGGDNVGDEAKALEFAGKENRIDFIDENVNSFAEDYRQFVDQVKIYLGM